MFKFRDKRELIGVIMGATCFIPTFVIAMMIGAVTNFLGGVVVMLISQALWLISIELCTRSLERENRKLKDKIKHLQELGIYIGL